MELTSVFAAMIESGNPTGFLNVLILMYIAWRVIKPFIVTQIEKIDLAVSTQLGSVKTEIANLGKNFVELAGHLKSLEDSNHKRFTTIEISLEETRRDLSKIKEHIKGG